MFGVPDVMGPGLVLRNFQVRKAVQAKPTRVGKLIRTSKNFFILSMIFISLSAFCFMNMVVLSPAVGDGWNHPIDAANIDPEPPLSDCSRVLEDLEGRCPRRG